MPDMQGPGGGQHSWPLVCRADMTVGAIQISGFFYTNGQQGEESVSRAEHTKRNKQLYGKCSFTVKE